jgi:NAD(P)-dependent dehydrogenase (short-subunit alcohol dehydrogenase family)
MPLPLADRIALVTGASRGIGCATAKALAKSGAHIVAVARTQGGLEELDDEIRNIGGSATLVPLNLTDLDGIARLGAALLRQSEAGRAVFITSGAAAKATAYVGPYAASKAALETLARTWAHETASTSLRVNLFNPGPIRTRMRAILMPGEDPTTLDTPEQAADLIVPMCAPAWSVTGKLYDYPTRELMSFRPPA